MESVKSWKNGQKCGKSLGKTDKTAPFYIRKEGKDMIKRKIDRHLANFFKTDKKRVCHIP